ncbi:PTS system, fructose-specific IIABC component [Spiroplasma sp. TIUS-1]|uniref:PTS fructose transporter subunit IIABC n=1 Tax=Spiroplasma sp. TIUS-1 TaxID=216963 RepID=UPI001398BF30|nr:fructose-specific PTS transporter subunit EIIC [Spiroplasma sp. TIUS-1]QHX35709.1 PTS system, fructose-specific IIABC component [Spiroplasma sp. TIUS-1]
MNKDILNSKHIFLDVELNSQDEVFDFLAKKAKELGIVTSDKALVAGFKKRESESSTGFEDGFAIPHARIVEANQAACLVVKLKKAIDWNSMDGKPTQYLFSLIVPDGKGDEHMSILSDIATKLIIEEFKSAIINAKTQEDVLKAFNVKKVESKQTTPTEGGLKIVAISACTVGIAHTYMAEEKLIQEGKKMGHQVRVETHGSKGIGTPLTKKEIDEADIVIFAVDVNVDNSRFVGKKFYKVPVAKAIKDTQKVINIAIKDGAPLAGAAKFETSGKVTGERQTVMSHILAGISYMIPVIVLGGICLAFSLGIAKAVWGPTAGTDGSAWIVAGDFAKGWLVQVKDGVIIDGSGVQWVEGMTLPTLAEGAVWGLSDGSYIRSFNGTDLNYTADFLKTLPVSPWGPLAVMDKIGGAAFTLMIPILAGFIANSIGGRAAIGPAMVGAFIGNNAAMFMTFGGMNSADMVPTGFIGAIIAGLLVGYAVSWINTWNVPKSLRAAMPIFFIPLITGILISMLFIYVIGGPIGWVMFQFSDAIKSAYESKAGAGVGIALGILIGAMAGFDMGGPINKIAFVTCSALITMGIYEPMGTMAAAIPVAPIGMGLTSLLFGRFFNSDERGMGSAAVIMGSIGISEGAIPFAIRDPKRAIASNVVGSAVAGAIAGGFMVQNMAAHGGPIVAILGAVPYGVDTLYYFIAAAAGIATTVLVYGFWLTADSGAIASVKEAHVAKLVDLSNEKSSKIDDIKEEIKVLKLSKNVSAIDVKKSEIAKVKDAYKADVEKAKAAYAKVKPEEKALMTTKKEDVKSFTSTLKANYTTAMASIKSDTLKGDTKTDAIEKAKLEKANKYREFQEGIRGELVSKYLAAAS